MATITASSNATTAIQASLARSRLAQAQREADQAQATANDLRTKADNADRDVQKSQNTVRDLAARSRQLDVTYDRQLRGNTSELPLKAQDLLANLYSSTNQINAIKGAANDKSNSPFIIVNSQGQATGRIVNVTA
jgi:hypothetical protein